MDYIMQYVISDTFMAICIHYTIRNSSKFAILVIIYLEHWHVPRPIIEKPRVMWMWCGQNIGCQD